MPLSSEQLVNIIEAALMVAGRPLTPADLLKLFDEDDLPEVQAIKSALASLQTQYGEKGIELKEVASGFQFQARAEYSPWLSRLWDERAPRYSRAILETIALIAYRQPITRAEIEEIRGVAVSSHIVKTLLERDWVKVIGYKDVPGKPALYGTTKALLDHLNLKSLSELPSLADIKDLDSQEEKLQIQLNLTQEIDNNNTDVTETQTHQEHMEIETSTASIDMDAEENATSEKEQAETF